MSEKASVPLPREVPSALPPDHSLPTTKHPKGETTVRPMGTELGAEVQLLATAQELMEARDLRGAQSTLERYRREFPKGTLQAEALALETDVAAAQGRNADVMELGSRFLATYPASPHVARVRAAMARANADQ
ncbi:MAG: hypothetical protein NVS3B20_07400 [Polyangiales bacterium]